MPMLIDKDINQLKSEALAYDQAIKCLESYMAKANLNISILTCMDNGFYIGREFGFLRYDKDQPIIIGKIIDIGIDNTMIIEFNILETTNTFKCQLIINTTTLLPQYIHIEGGTFGKLLLIELIYFLDIDIPNKSILFKDDPYQKNLKLYKALDITERTKLYGYGDDFILNQTLSKDSTTELLIQLSE